MTFAWINDRLVESASAAVSIHDRGFRYGDGVFDTLRLFAGAPYRWRWHLERMERALAALKIPLPACDVRQACETLIETNAAREGLLRIAVTRGSGSEGYLPAPDGNGSTLVVETLPLPTPPTEPVTLWLSAVEKISPRALPVRYKLSAQGMNATLAKMEAREHGCFDALQLDAQGHVSEASSANMFWLEGETLYTPALASGCLEGSIRARLMELSPLVVMEERTTLDALMNADAVFLTNVALLVQPVAALHPHGKSWPGTSHLETLRALLERDVRDHCTAHAWS